MKAIHRPTIQAREDGFTLIELIVAVAIIGILARIAIPLYSDYILRSHLVDGVNGLSSARVQMEQFFQDNRTYSGGPFCSATSTSGDFSVTAGSTCSATQYTLSATAGTSTVAKGFTYKLDQDGTKTTSSVGTSWGGAPGTPYACWWTTKGAC
jgi:type IV pilus assembly protein PilE